MENWLKLMQKCISLMNISFTITRPIIQIATIVIGSSINKTLHTKRLVSFSWLRQINSILQLTMSEIDVHLSNPHLLFTTKKHQS